MGGTATEGRLSWVDFTRRNDPAHPAGAALLEEKLKKHGPPRVLCFWTKAPARVSHIYAPVIASLRQNGTLVLAQVTLNNYREMEPGIKDADRELGPLVEILGGPEHIRLRFDPIVDGYTRPEHFQKTVEVARKYGIRRIITNFLVPEYKGVGNLLAQKGFQINKPSRQRKIEILAGFLKMAGDIELAVCAESKDLILELPRLKKAACSDAEWAISLRPELEGMFSPRPSRPGCGCCYAADWGLYKNWGGYTCPHQCLYCYAK
ncbi:MAG: hypothetical protein PWP65_1677 [Clostridia bacterium]|nr:hypothetical protein [Clostridia bacterium]